MNEVISHSSESMVEIEDNSVALVVTSPPYPMIEKWDGVLGGKDRADDTIERCLDPEASSSHFDMFKYQHAKLHRVWKECRRVLIDGGIMCINIGDATRTMDFVDRTARKKHKRFMCYPNQSMLTMQLYDLGLVTLIPILWRKISNRPNAFLGSGMVPTNGYIAQDCEHIVIARKGLPRKFKPKDPNRYDSSFTKSDRDQWFQQIWNIPGAKGAKEISAFPEEVPRRLIRMFSVIGDTVLDPFSGTGTTPKVARVLDRNFIGYHTDKFEDTEEGLP